MRDEGTKAQRHEDTKVKGNSTYPSVPSCLHAFVPLLLLTLTSSTAIAAPTQEDVFKSIQTNVGESGAADSGKMLALFAGVGAVVILLVLFSQRQRREAAPKVLHHPGKLLKEVMRDTGLRPAELKQLKILAEETRVADGEPLQSPLTLLLCPSVLAKAVHARTAKIDRRVVAQVVRKLGTATGQ